MKYGVIYDKNTPEETQISDINMNASLLYYMFKSGIIPSEAVQLAAVKQMWLVGPVGEPAIQHILKQKIIPSEAVQLAAVNQYKFAMKYLLKHKITPSQEVLNAHYIRWEL